MGISGLFRPEPPCIFFTEECNITFFLIAYTRGEGKWLTEIMERERDRQRERERERGGGGRGGGRKGEKKRVRGGGRVWGRKKKKKKKHSTHLHCRLDQAKYSSTVHEYVV